MFLRVNLRLVEILPFIPDAQCQIIRILRQLDRDGFCFGMTHHIFIGPLGHPENVLYDIGGQFSMFSFPSIGKNVDQDQNAKQEHVAWYT